MSEWQPIETAPKNEPGERSGPWIQVWYAYDACIYTACWGFHESSSQGVWLCSSPHLLQHGVHTLTRQHDITHWMPLPACPTTDQ